MRACFILSVFLHWGTTHVELDVLHAVLDAQYPKWDQNPHQATDKQKHSTLNS
jgi:hypothetical protein